MRRRTGARARSAVDLARTTPMPGEPAGVPARCASNIHADRKAVVWGTFRKDPNRPDPTDKTNVGYCAQCAHVLHLVGWFQPDEGQRIPGEE